VIELRVLGSVSVIGGDACEIDTVATQTRRLALLAYLAAATPRGMHRRDTLAALFWPELDQPHARAALRQAVYVLRSALGANALSSRGDEEIGLAFDTIRCDVAAFDDALAAGRFEQALELYRGDLLEGFFITAAPDFEDWLERERGRLRAAVSHAAQRMFAQSEAVGDLTAAAHWARRAVRLSPHDEDAARRLMRVLLRAGDRVASVQVYRDLAKRLAEVYEVAPSPETEALLAAVRAPPAPPAPNEAVHAVESVVTPSAVPATPRRLRDDRWRASAFVVVAILLIFGLATSAPRRTSVASADMPQSVAILPMTFTEGDSALGRTAVDLSEALTTDVGRVTTMRVTARRAVLSIARGSSLQRIGQLLRTSTVVESDLRRNGQQIAIDVALLDVSSGEQRWSERFEGDPRTAMALERRIARRLVTALGAPAAAVNAMTRQLPTTNSAEAFDLFSRAKFHFRHETRSDDSLAIVLLEGAVAADPSFAAAYAYLGRAYAMRALQFAPEDSTASERALFAADKALRLDPELAEAHYARGMILWGPRNHFTFEFAVREYRRALELNPNLDDAHHQLGTLYLHIGLLDKAVAELEKTLALDPTNSFAQHRIGVALVDQGRYEEGLRALRAIPSSFNPALWYYHVTWALLYLDRDDEAAALINEYLLKHPEDRGGVVTSIRAILRAKHGDAHGAEHDIKAAEALGAGYVHFHHTEYNIASAYALMRRPREALPWLRRAADDGWPCYPSFARDPNLNNMRTDPEFLALLGELRMQWERYRATL